MRQAFGRCLFDRDRRDLTRDGSIVSTGPKLLALLELLIDAAPRAVTKGELTTALWPDTFVADATLTGLVADLRAAIGDDARTPHLLRTITGTGTPSSARCPPPRRPDRSARRGPARSTS